MSLNDIPVYRQERMSTDQEKHLGRIIMQFWKRVDKKYRAGQKEHGGNLFDQSPLALCDLAIDEAVDQVVYLLTLRERLTGETYDAHPYDKSAGERSRVSEGIQGGVEGSRPDKDKPSKG